jgi:centrosomal protein POC5
LEGARKEVQRLHAERDRYEETMKKAFMRGVCALNLEAMGMFQQSANAVDAASTARKSLM